MTLPTTDKTTDKGEQTFSGQVVLGRYHVVLPLGAGGQGMVHLARAEGAAGVARPVVIKRVLAPLANDKATRARFIREARITARLRHPDIVSIVEFERESDNSYLMVLEYVHGYDLWRWARFVHALRGGISARLLAYVGTRVLDALHYSHGLRDPDGTATPVIHRDVSAGNVLIDVTGQIKLTDFGIASMVRDDAADRGEHGLQGKLGYIAPELFGGAPASAASDIYACGVMLHALLLGKNEFQAADIRGAEALALKHVATRIDIARKDVSKAAGDVLARALAKDPAQRFETAGAFSAELRRAFSLDVAEAREEFAKVVERDFEDPAFAEKMGVLSLRQIDAAWRKQEGDLPTDSLRPSRSTAASLFPALVDPDSDTRNLGGRNRDADNGVAGRAPSRRRKLETLGWSLAIMLLVALVVTLIGVRARPSAEGRVLYVEAQPVAVPSVAAPSAAVQRPVEPTVPSEDDPKARAKPVRPGALGKTRPTVKEAAAAPGTVLTERFAQKRADVSRCFLEHQGKQTFGRLSVAFEVDPQGKVERAELEPHQLANTKLGECLLAVSRSTLFGAQPGYMRFRIPISAQTYQDNAP